MPVPTYDKFIEPVLRYLAAAPGGALAREVHDAAASVLNISDLDRQELLPSGTQAIYKNRAGWAHDRLKRASLSNSPRRGYWQLTQKGIEYARTHSVPLPENELEELAVVRLSPPPDESMLSSELGSDAISKQPIAPASPDDRLGEALAELRHSVAVELQEALSAVSPAFFETVVLDVLHRMGYGASRSDLQRLGGSGDAGIDGIISLDKLGLEKVYVQAKRWQHPVGRPEVHGFYGALAGQRAAKGVFITTSNFTPHAVEFARSVDRIILVDGHRLAEFMIDYEVGITARMIRVPKLDRDYFDEE